MGLQSLLISRYRGTIIDIASVVDSIFPIILLHRVRILQKLDGKRRAHMISQQFMLVQGVVRSLPGAKGVCTAPKQNKIHSSTNPCISRGYSWSLDDAWNHDFLS